MNTVAPLLDDPGMFLEIDDLEIATLALVDSVQAGPHRSPIRGAGLEFDRHRDYQRGDDLRLINWRLYSRSRRLYLKQYRIETNMPVRIAVDASASMRTGGRQSKYRYAARAAAAMAWLASRGGDAFGLGLMDQSLSPWLPPRTGRVQFENCLSVLEQPQTSDQPGDLLTSLDELCETCRSRGVVLLFSDFIEDPQQLTRRLSQLRQQGQDVRAVQILAPDEAILPTSGDFHLTDPESGQFRKTSLELVHADYNAAIDRWRSELDTESTAAGIRWLSITTAFPLAETVRSMAGALNG